MVYYVRSYYSSMLLEKELKTIVTDYLHLSSKDLLGYEKQAKKINKPLEQYLLDENIVGENDLYAAAAKLFEVPFVSLKGKEIKKDTLNLVPAPMAQTHHLIAFDSNKNEVSLALLDPEDIETIEFIRRKTGLSPKIFLATPSDIKTALRRYHADLEQDINIVQISDTDGEDGSQDLKKAAEELPVVNIVNSIVEHAVYEDASDIHIEPTETEVVVRYRIDGELHPVMSLPKAVQSGIVARIKVLSNLKIDEHMVPQDGRFKIQVQEEKYAFRVSIIPVYDGEKIVMRLLNEGQKPLTLDQLGFLPSVQEIINRSISKPHGMVIVTGPTGSGKTTTLYSMLGMLNQPDVNISTAEDPVEYHVKGVNQSQMNPKVGFTFAAALRSFLRQDPDIIMVGEIRDQETAEIAIHAAMTGHLVLSTLHTNDAPTTIPRLLDMDIPPFLVAFTMNVIIAQRLVRRICQYCKKEYHLEKDAIKELERLFNVDKLTKLFLSQKLDLKKEEKTLQSMTFYRGEGCGRCNNSGYKGRVGIYEALEMDKKLIEMVNARGTAEQIKDYAVAQGMVTIMEDGLIKAKQGVTTIEEVLRATRE